MEDKQLEDALAETIEKSFNDSELEDIMNEIENLEKEFSDEAADQAGGSKKDSLALDKAKSNSLQDAIDAEVDSIVSEVQEEPVMAADSEEKNEEIMEVATEPTAEVIDESAPVSDEVVMMPEDEAISEPDILAQIDEETEEISASAETPEEIHEELQAVVEETHVEPEIVAQDAHVEPDTVAEEAPVESEEIVEEPEEEFVAFTEEELAAVAADTEDEEVDEVEPTHHENVVSFDMGEEKAAPSAVPTASNTGNGGNVNFNANGAMDLNINFEVAGEVANLKVESGGLSLHMNGVELTINEEGGCSVKMAGGVSFSIPLDGKKAA